MRLLLVDGSNLLFQMFYGMPARILGRRGQPIHGTLGFVGALRRILAQVQPTHALVLFDGEHEPPRTQLDAGYKANRSDFSDMAEDETPFSQLPDVYAALDLLGIRRFETLTCEADDLIAAYALALEASDTLVIASFDSDFFQLLAPNVSVLRYRGERTVVWTPALLRDKLGIAPQQYADFKALTGDASDALRGAKGVGSKTAAALLREFGTLEHLLDHAQQIKKASVRTSVSESTPRLRLNYRLIHLDGSAALPFATAQLTCVPCTLGTMEILRRIGAK